MLVGHRQRGYQVWLCFHHSHSQLNELSSVVLHESTPSRLQIYKKLQNDQGRLEAQESTECQRSLTGKIFHVPGKPHALSGWLTLPDHSPIQRTPGDIPVTSDSLCEAAIPSKSGFSASQWFSLASFSLHGFHQALESVFQIQDKVKEALRRKAMAGGRSLKDYQWAVLWYPQKGQRRKKSSTEMH